MLLSLRRRRPSKLADIRRGLVAYWPLANSAAVDLRSALYGGGPLDLTNNNTVTREDGPSDNLPDAANFVAASSQSLTHANDPAFDVADSDFTFAGWVYFASSPASMTFTGRDNGSTQRSYWIGTNGSSQMTLQTFNGTSRVGNAVAIGALSVETWYFLFGRYTFSSRLCEISLDMALDGSLYRAVTASDDITNSTAQFDIGGRNGAALFLDGRLSGLGFWKRLLTNDELTWLYNGGEGRELLNLV